MYRDSDLTEWDWEVFAEYGRTMFGFQWFEFALLVAADIELPDASRLTQEEYSEVFDNEVGKVLRLTAGQLKAKLAKETDIPDNLLEDITVAVRNRNYLAHEYLRNYAWRRDEDPLTFVDSMETLKMAREEIEDLNRRLLSWGRDGHT